MERGGALEPVDATEDVVIPTEGEARIVARVYTPRRGARVGGRLVWLHGGGWIIGDLEGFDWVSRSLANASGAGSCRSTTGSPPEHPFPAGVRDADAALAVGAGARRAAWRRRRQRRREPGGRRGRAHARDAGLEVAAQLLVYPATDATMAGDSYRESPTTPLLSGESMRACWGVYAARRPQSDPDVSPLHAADLSGLPPTLVAVAGHDVLCDDGVRYAEALRKAGVDVELDVYEDMAHGFLRWAGVVERSRELIDSLGAFAARHLGG